MRQELENSFSDGMFVPCSVVEAHCYVVIGVIELDIASELYSIERFSHVDFQ